MSTFRRDMILIYSAVAVATVGAVALLVAELPDSHVPCPDVVRQRVVAPDSMNEAIVWNYGCGWATKGVAMVAIGDVGTAPQRASHVLGLMDADGARLLLNRAVPPHLMIRWVGPDTVVLRYSRTAKLLGPTARVARGVYVRQEPEP